MSDNLATKRHMNGQIAEPESTRHGRTFVPSVDIIETEHEMLVIADVPGVKPENVDVTYEQGVLDLHARVEPRSACGNGNCLVREYEIGDFHRSFRLGETIDAAGIRAELKDGVLTLHLPKAEAARKRQIKVNAG